MSTSLAKSGSTLKILNKEYELSLNEINFKKKGAL